ncbi:MAG: T9SS type A sorting domain-containing protein [Bacteroidetes bacterium]|nr:T9SS type A sorting domain-containing protein [Bacteroidota bacterium]
MIKKLLPLGIYLCSLSFASSAQTFPSHISGLTAWFSADALELGNGAPVEEWKNNNNANYPMKLAQSTASFCPSFIENALNGKPVVRFNGSNQFLNGGDVLNIGTVGQSIFIIAKSINNGNNRTLLAKAANGTSQFSQNKYAIRYANTNVVFFEYTDVQTYRSQNSEVLPDYAIITSTVDLRQGMIALFANSKRVDQLMTRQNHVFTSNFDFLLGAYNGNNGMAPPTVNTQFNGDVAEIIAYNRAVTQQERQAIENYLRLKYFPGTERLPISLGDDVIQPYSLQPLELEVPDRPYFTSFLWNTGQITRQITAEKSGTYSVKVIDNWGWEYYDTIVFSKPEIKQMRDTLLCAGESFTWDCGIAGDYTYTWSTGETTQSIKIQTAGNYWVEVKDKFGNTARSATIRVDVDNFPVEASLGTETELCKGNFLELVSGNTANIVSYQWNTGATTARLQVNTPGEYWLKATNANNCVAHKTISITIKATGTAPQVNFTIENACEKQITTLRQNSTNTDGSHIVRGEWTIGGETFDGLTREHTFAAAGEQLVRLKVTTNLGCSATLQKMVAINPTPNVNFSPLMVCQNIETTLHPQVSISQGTINRYEWQLPGEIIIAQSLRKTFTTSGEIPVALEVTSDKGCKNTAQNNLMVRSTPELNISYSANCERNPVFFFDRTLYTAINNAVSRTWFINNQAVSNNAVFSITMNTTSHVRYVVRTMNGCELSWEKPIILAPLPRAIVDSVFSCTNAQITMTDRSTGNGDEIAERQWLINNVLYNEENPTLKFAEVGTYDVMLTVKTENNCIDSVRSAIEIEAAPKASFTHTPETGVATLPILYTNTSTDATNFTWTFAENEVYEINNQTPFSRTFADTANTHVQLVAHSSYGCTDVVEQIIPLQAAHHRLKIVDCTLSENFYGTEATIHVVNTGNVPVRYINFIFQQNTMTPFAEMWNGRLEPLAPGDTLKYRQVRVTQGSLENFAYITVQAHILENPQGEPLFSTWFTKDFAKKFTVHSLAPVPANDVVHIKFASIDETPVTITLYNMLGNVSFSAQVAALVGFNEITLNVAQFAPGRYECHITQGGQTVRKSLLIQ